jgi:hypothetical protein
VEQNKCGIYLKKNIQRYVGDFYVLNLSIFVTTLTHFVSLRYIVTRLEEVMERCYLKTNRKQRYPYLVIGRYKSYIVKSQSNYNDKYKQDEIIQIPD